MFSIYFRLFKYSTGPVSVKRELSTGLTKLTFCDKLYIVIDNSRRMRIRRREVSMNSTLNLDVQREKLLAILAPSSARTIEASRVPVNDIYGKGERRDALTAAANANRLLQIESRRRENAQEALRKLNMGMDEYMACSGEKCGWHIAERRLLGTPEAILCVRCQQRLDRSDTFFLSASLLQQQYT